MMGFLARPTWTGPVGLVEVCSTLTLMPVGLPLPKDSPCSATSVRRSVTRAVVSTVKFRYPLRGVTPAMRPQGALISEAIFSAMATGAIFRGFAKVKQGMARSAVSGNSLTSLRSEGAPMAARAFTTASSHSATNFSITIMSLTPACT